MEVLEKEMWPGLEYTLEYWKDDGWFVGRVKGLPNVFSQGKTLEELEDNIQDAWKLVTSDRMAK